MGIFDRKKIKKFPNGEIEELFYVNINGNKNGEYTRYHENGLVFQKAFFENDVQEGVSQTFDLKGKLIRERNFINGLTKGPIKEYYKDGLIKLIIEDISIKISSSYYNQTKHSFYNERGKLFSQVYTKKIYFTEPSSITSSLTYNLQKHETGDKILPFSTWLTYNESGNVISEIDFEISKPNSYIRNFKGINNTIEFSNSACEIRNYDSNGLLLKREQKSLDSIKEGFFSDDLSSIKFRSENDDSELLDPIKFIVFTDFVLPRFSNSTSKELRDKFKIIKNPRNWIKGFDLLYDRHPDEEGDPPFNIPLYYESGEENYSFPSEHSYTKSHIQLYTLSEEDALKLINELMIFNGGVSSYKTDVESEVYSDMEVVFQNQIIRIYKSYPNESIMPINDLKIPVKLIFIGIDLLPPKNLVRYNVDSLRGIHPDSEFVNNLLTGLDKPILCNADGGVTDGRLFVIADDKTDIILSSYEDDFDIDLFKNIVKSFSKSNPILELKNTDIIKMADSFDFINESNTGKYGSYQPIMDLKKKDCVLSLIIADKVMVSLLKNHGYYQIRIDKKCETDWKKLKFSKKDKLEFYISETQKEILDSDFNTEVSKLHELFTEKISSIDEEFYVDKYDLNDEVDFPYWYENIKKRANSGLSQVDGIMDDEKIAEYIYGHANEYENRLVDEDYEFKEMFIKFRVIGFGECYKLLIELEKKIDLLKNKFAIKNYPSEDKIFNELAHGKASLYGAIKYALSIGIKKTDIRKYYSDFIDDKNLIKGVDPFDSFRDKLGLESNSKDEVQDNGFIEKVTNEMNLNPKKHDDNNQSLEKKINEFPVKFCYHHYPKPQFKDYKNNDEFLLNETNNLTLIFLSLQLFHGDYELNDTQNSYVERLISGCDIGEEDSFKTIYSDFMNKVGDNFHESDFLIDILKNLSDYNKDIYLMSLYKLLFIESEYKNIESFEYGNMDMDMDIIMNGDTSVLVFVHNIFDHSEKEIEMYHSLNSIWQHSNLYNSTANKFLVESVDYKVHDALWYLVHRIAGTGEPKKVVSEYRQIFDIKRLNNIFELKYEDCLSLIKDLSLEQEITFLNMIKTVAGIDYVYSSNQEKLLRQLVEDAKLPYLNNDENSIHNYFNSFCVKISQKDMDAIFNKMQESFQEERKKIDLVLKINKEKDIIKQEKIFLSEFKKDSDNHFLLNSLAYNQYKQKKYKQGIGFVKKAIKISKTNGLLDTLGLGYFYTKEFSKALEMFNACIDKDIENKKELGEHYFNRANTYLEIGRLSESKDDYNKCIEIKDGFEDRAKLAIEKINKNPLNGKF